MVKTDFLIIGAGIIGLSIAKAIQDRYPDTTITIIEKEDSVAKHASGRNSGVLHAGFYYTADSLKAKFTRDGNIRLKEFCKEYNLALNECGKVVVARDEGELETLYELYHRGKTNGVRVEIIDEKRLSQIEPNAKTNKEALYSPDTATVNPIEVTNRLKDIVVQNGAKIYYDTAFLHNLGLNKVITTQGEIEAEIVINCAGLYADRVAKTFGFSKDYTIIPFKGIYLKYSADTQPIKTNIYPVPKLENPFLGVHYTVTVDGSVKIGPTAIPAFGRENYGVLKGIDLDSFLEIIYYEAKLFLTNSFGFRDLAFEEFAKYNKNRLAKMAEELSQNIDSRYFNEWSRPGIRAQLLNKNSLELVQDFVVEADIRSIHILNAVSPAFTCSLPFAEWVVKKYI